LHFNTAEVFILLNNIIKIIITLNIILLRNIIIQYKKYAALFRYIYKIETNNKIYTIQRKSI